MERESNENAYLASLATWRDLHLYVFKNYETIGYEKTQQLIRLLLTDTRNNFNADEIRYLEKSMHANGLFETYKENLLKIIAVDDWIEPMNLWILDIRKRERTKQEIGVILLELSVFVQFHPSTKGNWALYYKLCDLLDSFTDYGPNYKTLPDEPNIKFI